MFLGRPWRKKRKLLLLAVQATQKTSSMSIWRAPLQNVSYREKSWLEACYRSHDCFCGCNDFIFHLTNLAARFNFQGPPPEGGTPRPRPPLLRALPQPSPRRETRTENPGRSEPWPGDGGEGAGGRPAGDGAAGDAAGDYRAEDIDALFDAIERDTQ